MKSDAEKIKTLIHKIKGTNPKNLNVNEIKINEHSGEEWLKSIIDQIGNKKDSKRIFDMVNNATLSNMYEKYTKNGKIPPFNGELMDYSNIPDHRPDYENWCTIAHGVLLYQSLGDTLGYRNGIWEFNYGDTDASPEYVNELIYEFIDLGGVNDISIKNWLASDDTIMYIICAYVIGTSNINNNVEDHMDSIFIKMRDEYIYDIPLLETRHPGDTTMNSLELQKSIEWNKLPYNSKSIGAGAAMRTGFIGILYPGAHNRRKLLKLAIECARITHNSGIAYLGSVVTALYTAYAIEKIDVNKWPHKLLKLLKSGLIQKYVEKSRPNDIKYYVRDEILFIGQWEKYIKLLFIGINPRSDLKFMKNPVERFRYLISNFSKGCEIPGACGDDCTIIAYDSLLRCDGVFEKLIVNSILHPGDSDTVGSIAFSWYGAYYHTPYHNQFVSKMFNNLEMLTDINNVFTDSIKKISYAYFMDIYRNIASKHLITYVKNNY